MWLVQKQHPYKRAALWFKTIPYLNLILEEKVAGEKKKKKSILPRLETIILMWLHLHFKNIFFLAVNEFYVIKKASFDAVLPSRIISFSQRCTLNV